MVDDLRLSAPLRAHAALGIRCASGPRGRACRLTTAGWLVVVSGPTGASIRFGRGSVRPSLGWGRPSGVGWARVPIFRMRVFYRYGSRWFRVVPRGSERDRVRPLLRRPFVLACVRYKGL